MELPYLYRYFRASRGEHIRVAISWWSNADCPDEANCSYDRLDTDLHLGVKDPDGQWVPGAWSASWDNNYELVDFTAPKTGKYRIAVYKEASDSDEDFNYLGLAWARDATYLPDVRGNFQGWNSVLRVRNDGAQGRNVTVTFFDRNGTPNSRSAWRNPNQLWAFNVASLIGSNFVGTAIVDGGEDMSVEVMNIHQSYPYATGSYTGLTEGEKILYLPLLQRANNSMYSDLTLFNVGATQATVQIQYIPENGSYSGCTASNITIPSNGSHNFNSRDGTLGCTTSSPFVGGAKVTSSQPLVAVANQWRDVGANGSIEGFMSYEAFSTGGTVSYMPLLQYNNNGWYTSSNL